MKTIKPNILDWLSDIRLATVEDDYHAKVRLHNAAGSDEQSTVDDPYGGYLVPEIWRPTLQEVKVFDPTVDMVTTVPMTSNRVHVPARVDKDHATVPSTQTGGFRMLARSETQAATSSRGEVELVTLNAHSITGLVYVTEEMMQDDPGAASLLVRQGLAQQLGYYLLDKKINGTGVGEPEGILNSPCNVVVSRAPAQDVFDMASRAWRLDQSIWLVNNANFREFMVGSYEYSLTDVAVNHAYFSSTHTVCGRPVYLCEFVPTGDSAGSIILWQPSEYLLGVRSELLTESIYIRFAEHENAFRFVWRGDGRMWWRSALTPRFGANTLSPVVSLGGA